MSSISIFSSRSSSGYLATYLVGDAMMVEKREKSKKVEGGVSPTDSSAAAAVTANQFIYLSPSLH